MGGICKVPLVARDNSALSSDLAMSAFAIIRIAPGNVAPDLLKTPHLVVRAGFEYAVALRQRLTDVQSRMPLSSVQVFAYSLWIIALRSTLT